MVSKLASAIYNDIVSGLAGITSTPAISMEQLEDDVVDEKLQVIKEYIMKGILPKHDLLVSINCIETDCKSLDKCPCGVDYTPPQLHFEIPQLIMDFGLDAIDYIGAVDKSQHYKVYVSAKALQYHKYKRRGANKPYVYIDPTPNKNNMLDGWIFNAPFTKIISAMIIPKDDRQLDYYGCCNNVEEVDNITFIYTEIKKRLTEKKIRYYRQLLVQPHPNDQAPA